MRDRRRRRALARPRAVRGGRRVAGRWRPKAKTARCNPAVTVHRVSALLSNTHPLAILLGGLVEIFGFGLSENSQNVNQVARGAAGCLCGSALEALAKSVSEFQENPFVARIADLGFRPFPDGTFRVENTVFHLPMPDLQRLVLFTEHGLKEGFNQCIDTSVRAGASR